MSGEDNVLVKTIPLLKLSSKPWETFLSLNAQEHEIALFRKHERTGRPLGEDLFVEKLERLLERNLKPQKPGSRNKNK